MRGFWLRVMATLRRGRAERELEAELAFHLEMQTAENIERGMPAEEARRAALASFGGMEQTKEIYRERRGFRLFDCLRQDLKYALRVLRRNPGFAAVAVLVLGLGIGATTAAFSVVRAVVLRPLPYPEASRLTAVLSSHKGAREAYSSAPGVYLDWRERATSFETLAGVQSTEMILDGNGAARRVTVAEASWDFPTLLGARPLLGRQFRAEEDREGADAVALLEEGYWRREFGASRQVLGRTLRLDGRLYTVVGVLPEGTRFARSPAPEVWVPLSARRAARTGGFVLAVGRLRRGVTRTAAQAEISAIMRQIGREHPEDAATLAVVKPLQDWVVGGARRDLLLLLGAAACVLLIGCSNIATLTLARATVRGREMATRAALGAGRARLILQILVENGMLAAGGGLLGLALASALVWALPALDAITIPRIEEVRLDEVVLAAAAALAFGSALISGITAAFFAGRKDLGTAMGRGDAPAPRAVGGARLRSGLVVVQLALAVVLTSGAALMTNTLARLLTIDLGFDRANLVTVQPAFQPNAEAGQRVQLVRRLAAEVARIPGVSSVSAMDVPPLAAVLFPYELRSQGRSAHALARNVDVGYLEALRIPLLSGRDFTPADDARQPVPVLINRALAEALFGAQSPLGREITTDYRERRRLEVIGVVGDSRQLGLTQPAGRQMFLPLVQGWPGYVVARVLPGAGGVASEIRKTAARIDRGAAPPEIDTLEEAHARAIARPRFHLELLGAFAGVGLVLAGVGIYGVISYSVVRRTHEFGIRIALGAAPRDIRRLVLSSGVRIAIAGLALGLAGALATTRLIAAWLYEVKPADPPTLAGVIAVLAAVVLGTSARASRGAGRDHMAALREE